MTCRIEVALCVEGDYALVLKLIYAILPTYRRGKSIHSVQQHDAKDKESKFGEECDSKLGCDAVKIAFRLLQFWCGSKRVYALQ